MKPLRYPARGGPGHSILDGYGTGLLLGSYHEVPDISAIFGQVANLALPPNRGRSRVLDRVHLFVGTPVLVDDHESFSRTLGGAPG